MNFSDYLSVFAVVISSLSLYLSWRQYSRDRSHLQIDLKVKDDIRIGPMFVVSIVNAGRRPTTVAGGYALTSSGKRYPVYETPIMLEETKGFEFTVPFSGFFKSLSSGYFIKAFKIEDTIGRRYSINTRRLKAQIRKYMPVSSPAEE